MRASRTATRNDMSQLGKAGVLCNNTSLDSVMKLAENARLLKTIADIAPGDENRRRELVLVFGIRSHRGDMQTRVQVFSVYQRASAWCSRDGDIGKRKRLMHTWGYLAANSLQTLRKAPRTFHVTCPDSDLVDLADQP